MMRRQLLRRTLFSWRSCTFSSLRFQSSNTSLGGADPMLPSEADKKKANIMNPSATTPPPPSTSLLDDVKPTHYYWHQNKNKTLKQKKKRTKEDMSEEQQWLRQCSQLFPPFPFDFSNKRPIRCKLLAKQLLQLGKVHQYSSSFWVEESKVHQMIAEGNCSGTKKKNEPAHDLIREKHLVLYNVGQIQGVSQLKTLANEADSNYCVVTDSSENHKASMSQGGIFERRSEEGNDGTNGSSFGNSVRMESPWNKNPSHNNDSVGEEAGGVFHLRAPSSQDACSACSDEQKIGIELRGEEQQDDRGDTLILPTAADPSSQSVHKRQEQRLWVKSKGWSLVKNKHLEKQLLLTKWSDGPSPQSLSPSSTCALWMEGKDIPLRFHAAPPPRRVSYQERVRYYNISQLRFPYHHHHHHPTNMNKKERGGGSNQPKEEEKHPLVVVPSYLRPWHYWAVTGLPMHMTPSSFYDKVCYYLPPKLCRAWVKAEDLERLGLEVMSPQQHESNVQASSNAKVGDRIMHYWNNERDEEGKEECYGVISDYDDVDDGSDMKKKGKEDDHNDDKKKIMEKKAQNPSSSSSSSQSSGKEEGASHTSEEPTTTAVAAHRSGGIMQKKERFLHLQAIQQNNFLFPVLPDEGLRIQTRHSYICHQLIADYFEEADIDVLFLAHPLPEGVIRVKRCEQAEEKEEKADWIPVIVKKKVDDNEDKSTSVDHDDNAQEEFICILSEESKKWQVFPLCEVLQPSASRTDNGTAAPSAADFSVVPFCDMKPGFYIESSLLDQFGLELNKDGWRRCYHRHQILFAGEKEKEKVEEENDLFFSSRLPPLLYFEAVQSHCIYNLIQLRSTRRQEETNTKIG